MFLRLYMFTRRRATRARGLRARRHEQPAVQSRRPTVSTCELERLYNYGTLLRVR